MKKISSSLIKLLLPYVVAWVTNRKIREENKEKNWEGLSNYWKQTLAAKEVSSLEKIADDVYHSEIQRKETIESKAASMFEAIAFAVSLVSIAIVFIEKTKTTALILLLFPLVNFILAGICSWHATKIGEFFLPTLEGIKEDLELFEKKPESETKMHWIIEKLVNTEMNCPFILIKSNWLAAAYQHFSLGILSIIIIFVIFIFEINFVQVQNFFNNIF